MRVSRYRLRVVASLVVGATLVIAATAAAGLEPSPVQSIPESAFGPVVLDRAAPAPPAEPASKPNLRPLADPLPPALLAERPQPSLPNPKAIALTVGPRTAHSISGLASWYCRAGSSICTASHPDVRGFDAYAAAGPRLRAALGADWRGRIVYVDGIRVKLIDWCKCTGGSTGVEKLLDLYYDVFARTGSKVTIRW